AGDVIARDDVFGITRPSDATIATTIGVVRLPGSPPAQCLSTITPAGQVNRSPTSTIAWVSARTSLALNGRAAQAVRNDARWMSEYLPSTTSWIIDLSDGSVRSWP